MPPPKPFYDVDWVYSEFSNVHVATHRDWFTYYTPFDTEIKGIWGQPFHVAGIGHVELPTQTSSPDPGTIHLRDVLHVPALNYNVLGWSKLDDLHIFFSSSAPFPMGGWIKGPSRTFVGWLDCIRGLDCRLRLHGQSAEHTTLSYTSISSVVWPNTERAKWEAYLRDHAVDHH
ncbi:hypothetical protein XANCAGTX0491_003374 [Xanthoria calcicola]